VCSVNSLNFIVGECILLRMYQISKYKQTSFATVLQCAYLFPYLLTFSILYATTPDDGFELAETCRDIRVY
jgi:hypothetical protein